MLWSTGGFTLRLRGAGRFATTGSPHGVIGRDPRALLRLDDPAASFRHVYLHLDRRGLFAVDLATRTGTRVGAQGAPSGWLAPGDVLEVAGHEVEVVEVRVGAGDPAPPPGLGASPLDDAGDAPLASLALLPREPGSEPLRINSELVFAGRSAACAVPVRGPSAMRVQCVLFRTAGAAYVVDLVGQGTWRNDRLVRGAERIGDGDSLMIGSQRYSCRVDLPGARRRALPGPSLGATLSVSRPEPSTPREVARLEDFAPPLDLIPPEARAAVLGWLMNQIQARLDDAHRRQADFQTELVRLVGDIHRDNHTILQKHLERSEAIHDELEMLRDEMSRRFGPGAGGSPALPAPRPTPLNIAPVAPPDDPEAAAGWLINRVSQLDQESRSSWKDLIGKLSGRRPSE
ncbi:MAG: FHA domain-containing protein [Thermomicrobiales bacterium]